jgi:PLAT/LH2 domain
MKQRAIVAGALLGVLVATPSFSLPVSEVPTIPGDGSIKVNPPPDPKPQKPSTPIISVRGAHNIAFSFWDTSPRDTANQVQRSLGQTNVWVTIATYGALTGFQQYADPAYLAADTMYCYRVVASNSYGSAPGDRQCVYTKDGTGRGVVEAEIRLHTGTVANAETDDPVKVLLNSATTVYAVPSGNKTWLDYPINDFERGANYTYHLKTTNIGEIGDINMLSIQKEGGDAWCLADFELLVNGASFVSRSFASQPGGCLWLNDVAPNTPNYTLHFADLRAQGNWLTFQPDVAPAFGAPEVLSRLKSIIGDAIHDTSLYWGGLESPHADYLVTKKIENQNAMHVDVDLKAGIDGVNPTVDIEFDLVVSGGCHPDGTLTLQVTPSNVQVKADLDWMQEIAGFFECLVSADELTSCVESQVEQRVRDGLRFPSVDMAMDVDACVGHTYPWIVAPGTASSGAAILLNVLGV